MALVRPITIMNRYTATILVLTLLSSLLHAASLEIRIVSLDWVELKVTTTATAAQTQVQQSTDLETWTHFATISGSNVTQTYQIPTTQNRMYFRAEGGQALPTLPEASRFLTQATLGANYETIERVAQIGYDAWITEQIALPPSLHLPRNQSLQVIEQIGEEQLILSPFITSWWDRAMYAPDVLRQRVAFALSEIFVVSFKGSDILEDNQPALANYYDILMNGSFGNFRQMLYEVSTSAVMGHFLSHAGNRRSDPTTNRFPDENYAREVMQLFTIGLYELNQDGTRKKDQSGNDIPTYTNAQITEFAKIFTGMTYNSGAGEPILDEQEFIEAVEDNLTLPMARYGPMHEPGIKTLLNGATTDGGATLAGLEKDLNAAIDNLFQHPNVGPFIGRLLIQRLVKSNPSPAYISRVAAVFVNNGQGVRGDMSAVVRAILMDEEARSMVVAINDPTHGMLREPLVRFAHMARAFDMTTTAGNFKQFFPFAVESLGMAPLQSPSVFNFFLPDHQPLGPIAQAGLVAPEFQITNATTTISTINMWGSETIGGFGVGFETDSEVPGQPETRVDLTDEIALVNANNISGLVDRLDILLTRGTLSTQARQIIMNSLTSASATDFDANDTVRYALYLFANTAEFNVLK